MAQRKPSNTLIALLISNLACANPMMAARTATKKTTITITIEGDATADAAPAADVCPLDNDAARVLAPAQAGGVIVTPAFEYSVKSSDLSTPLAAGGTDITPAARSFSFEIKTPGRYYLASDTAARVSTGFINTTMIYINANNVIFDMNGKTLFPNGTGATNGAGLTAIRVAPSLSNVVIKNGQINGYQAGNLTALTTSYIANGIVVGGGCSNFTISDINISNIGGTANTATATPLAAVSGLQVNIGTSVCSNFILQNINVSNTNTAVDGISAAGLILYYCNNFKINSCSFSSATAIGTGIPVLMAYGVYMDTCNTLDFNDCTAAQNGTGTANDAFGFYTTTTRAVNFTDCAATQTTGRVTIGFSLATDGPFKLTNCIASNGSCVSDGIGFYIVLASVTLTNCSAESNASATSSGFKLFLAHGSKLINCQANNNSGTGFWIYNSDGVLLDRCTANGNASGSLSSFAAGFYLSNSSDSCHLVSCLAGENSAATADMPVYGFYSDSTSTIFNNCIAGHNQNTNDTGTAVVAGFSLSGASGNQFINCQARNNSAAGTGACTATGFYSINGTANEFRNCQAINNTAPGTTIAAGVAAGIYLLGEARSQILACNCSANSTSTTATTNTSTAAGIYLVASTANTIVRDCLLNFNTSAYLQYGFYDSASDTTSVLINNQAAGQGRCIALLTTGFLFPANTPMNYYFQSEGANENPRNIIVETDNFNWQTISTAVPKWSNISIVIGQVS